MNPIKEIKRLAETDLGTSILSVVGVSIAVTMHGMAGFVSVVGGLFGGALVGYLAARLCIHRTDARYVRAQLREIGVELMELEGEMHKLADLLVPDWREKMPEGTKVRLRVSEETGDQS